MNLYRNKKEILLKNSTLLAHLPRGNILSAANCVFITERKTLEALECK